MICEEGFTRKRAQSRWWWRGCLDEFLDSPVACDPRLGVRGGWWEKETIECYCTTEETEPSLPLE